jgi:hypothetical protein
VRLPGVRSIFTRRRVTETAWALLTALLAVIVGAIQFKVWDAHLRVPLLAPHGDLTQALTTITSIHNHGWWWHDSNLGAPFGAQEYDFGSPFGDTVNLLICKAYLTVVGDPAFVLNAYFFTTFALCAFTAHLVLRALGFSILICVAGGLLFAVLPFHFFRGEAHAFISGYWGVPLGVWLVLGVLGHLEIWKPRPGVGGWRRYVSWSSARILLVGFIVAGTLIYYAVFTVLLLVAAAGIVVFRARTWRAAVRPAVLAVVILGWFALMASPAFIYNHKHGKNPSVGVRATAEAEIYGLKGAQLLLPPATDKIGPLRKVGREYGRTDPFPSEGASPYLGLILALTFVGLIGYVLASSGRRRDRGRAPLLGDVGTLALVAFLIGTVGGISSLIAHLLTPQMRGWNRISTFIAFLTVIALAGVFERMLTARRQQTGTRARYLAVAAVVAVTAFAVYEQSSVIKAPDYDAVAADWYGYGQLVANVERELPKGASIVQLPYTPFPEHGPVGQMADYDQLVPYFFSKHLKWTAGSMKMRPEDWMALTYKMTPAELATASAAAGLGAIWVDRYGYSDSDFGKPLEAGLHKVISEPPEIGVGASRIAVYPLAGLAAREKAAAPQLVAQSGRALVHPVTVNYIHFVEPAHETALGVDRWAEKDPRLQLTPPGGQTRQIILRATLYAPAPAHVTMAFPDGSRRTFAATLAGVPIEASFSVRPGHDTILMTTDAPNVADPAEDVEHHFRLADVTVLDPATVALAKAVKLRASG